MYLIVGLGNPTREYEATRHNIGFDAVTAISDAWRISVDKREMKAITGRGAFGPERVILAKPQTYMNLSGEAVSAIAEYYRIEPDHVIVICDDINLAPGQLRIRAKGSAGGHNGLKNIILHLGTEDFPRIRVGVGEKPAEWDLADYVLGRFPKEEEPVIREALQDVVKACETIITEGIEPAMGRFNRKKLTPEEEEAKGLEKQRRQEERRKAAAERRKAAEERKPAEEAKPAEETKQAEEAKQENTEKE